MKFWFPLLCKHSTSTILKLASVIKLINSDCLKEDSIGINPIFDSGDKRLLKYVPLIQGVAEINTPQVSTKS
jgi:hypothetical protein